MLTKLYVKAQSLRGDEGATALEYGVLVAVIALVVAVGAGAFGDDLSAFFTGLAARVPLG
jgi:pilus assembly protein Flp/PilA